MQSCEASWYFLVLALGVGLAVLVLAVPLGLVTW